MSSYSIINPEFTFNFNGQEYQVKKANLEQVIEFQRWVKDVSTENDAAMDIRMVARAIFIILKNVDVKITEEGILKECPGGIDVIEVMTVLGFMNQQKIEMMTRARNLLVNPRKEEKPIGEKSMEQ